jgi:hypothetical protein
VFSNGRPRPNDIQPELAVVSRTLYLYARNLVDMTLVIDLACSSPVGSFVYTRELLTNGRGEFSRLTNRCPGGANPNSVGLGLSPGAALLLAVLKKKNVKRPSRRKVQSLQSYA